MDLISKRRHELTKAPGVAVTIRPLTEGRKISLVMKTAADENALAELRDVASDQLTEVHGSIVEAKRATEAGEDDADRLRLELERNPVARRLAVTLAEARSIQRGIHEELLKATLVKVEGLAVDGAPADVAGFIEFAPAEVFAEAVELARAATGLSEEEKGNSESPTTSPV